MITANTINTNSLFVEMTRGKHTYRILFSYLEPTALIHRTLGEASERKFRIPYERKTTENHIRIFFGGEKGSAAVVPKEKLMEAIKDFLSLPLS